MDKSKSYPGYSQSYSHVRLGMEDRPQYYSFNGPTGGNMNELNATNPEGKRRKRVAHYNMYAAEGRLKLRLRNSLKWLKSKFVEDFSS